jgi:hypothetical protein
MPAFAQLSKPEMRAVHFLLTGDDTAVEARGAVSPALSG